jgi:hypothetical protein
VRCKLRITKDLDFCTRQHKHFNPDINEILYIDLQKHEAWKFIAIQILCWLHKPEGRGFETG